MDPRDSSTLRPVPHNDPKPKTQLRGQVYNVRTDYFGSLGLVFVSHSIAYEGCFLVKMQKP